MNFRGHTGVDLLRRRTLPPTDGTGRNLRRELLPRGTGDVLRHLSALPHGYEFLSPGDGESYGDQLVKTMANRTTPCPAVATHATQETPTRRQQDQPILPYGPEHSHWLIQCLPEARLRHEVRWLLHPPRQKQVVDTLSAVLRGKLASANDDN
jgi:hypothetical protein